MKRSLREHFKNNDFVKPLYKKIKFRSRVRPVKKSSVHIDIDKPFGHGVNVKRKIVINKKTDFNVNNVNGSKSEFVRSLPNACEFHEESVTKFKVKQDHNKRKTNNAFKIRDRKMLDIDNESRSSKAIQAKNSVLQKLPETWLRVYPAPLLPSESILSVVFRCLVCQIGLAAFLVIWTVIWVFIINYFEEPYEMEVSLKFEKEQNQLVVDLATELRQITPVSQKWRYAIEKRIEDERQLTMAAMRHGAKLHPGTFWNLSGTFLFTVYVMTALGFGAPVPHTTWGRTSGLIYAALAIPTHIYLMVNVSTCVVANLETRVHKYKKRLSSKNPRFETLSSQDTGLAHCSRNSEFMNINTCRQSLIRILNVLYVGRCIPCSMMMYYALGAVCFGVLRSRAPVEIVMFPLEFTTTGGLERVKSHVRILYGFYVEGAMIMLACVLATLRSHSIESISYMSDKYRLFTIHKNEGL